MIQKADICPPLDNILVLELSFFGMSVYSASQSVPPFHSLLSLSIPTGSWELFFLLIDTLKLLVLFTDNAENVGRLWFYLLSL